MKKTFIFAILFFFVSLCSAQIQSSYTKNKKAMNLFDKAIFDYANHKKDAAITKLLKAIEIDTNFLEAYYMLGEINDINGNKQLAYKYYKNAYDIDSIFDEKLAEKLSVIAYRNGDYNQAKKYMDFFFINSDEKTIEVMKIKSFIDFAYESYNNPVDFQPINLGDGVNSKYNEYWPSLSIDEKTLVFTRLIPILQKKSSNTQDDFQEDLFVSELDTITNKYKKAYPMQSIINTELNEGAQCISGDGKTCVVTCCNRPDGKGSCDLYIMFNRRGRWTEPINMKTVNSSAWESNPSLSVDGRTLYFASNRPGGYGKIDIWRINIDEYGNVTSKAENLGNVINTEDNDVSPFIHPDGKTLYFASDGHPGMGEQDLFFSRLDENNQWTKPINLGYPINTKGEERSLIVNAKAELAMYASTGDKNDLDIFAFIIPETVQPTMVTYVKGYVYNTKNHSRIANANCDLINISNGKKVISIHSEDPTGDYMVALPVNNDYAFNVTKEGYLFYSESFSLKNVKNIAEPFLINIPLSPIEEGKVVVLKNIFFDFNESILLSESYVELEKLIEYLNNNPSIKIEIGGHTDNEGTKEYNKKLSENRAKAVYDYLVEKGINTDRLEYSGYDFSMPIADNNTKEGRALNRRTEFKIISTK